MEGCETSDEQLFFPRGHWGLGYTGALQAIPNRPKTYDKSDTDQQEQGDLSEVCVPKTLVQYRGHVEQCN